MAHISQSHDKSGCPLIAFVARSGAFRLGRPSLDSSPVRGVRCHSAYSLQSSMLAGFRGTSPGTNKITASGAALNPIPTHFECSRRRTASLPGDWESLRGTARIPHLYRSLRWLNGDELCRAVFQRVLPGKSTAAKGPSKRTG
jgi:hypothetical protein